MRELPGLQSVHRQAGARTHGRAFVAGVDARVATGAGRIRVFQSGQGVRLGVCSTHNRQGAGLKLTRRGEQHAEEAQDGERAPAWMRPRRRARRYFGVDSFGSLAAWAFSVSASSRLASA